MVQIYISIGNPTTFHRNPPPYPLVGTRDGVIAGLHLVVAPAHNNV